MPLTAGLSRAAFSLVHQRHLVYNTCWEDPRLDREALGLGPDDTVVMITSAGCNALDYALDAPKAIHAVDLNPRQNALLDLKLAGIRALDHGNFFDLFGRGHHRAWAALYRDALRPQLPEWSARFWDRHGHVFSGATRRGSFYYHGTTGLVAWLVTTYLRRWRGLEAPIEQVLAAPTVDHQREVWTRDIRPRLFGPAFRWLLGRDAMLALLAVPAPQREHLERDYPGGIAAFIVDRIEHVFTRLPLSDNYFWRLYLQGGYTPDCCPEYLRPAAFARLKAGLASRIHTHTMSIEHFLRQYDQPVTSLVLLDHMDWLCGRDHSALRDEWQAIVDRASPGARLIWRSGGQHTRFVDDLVVRRSGRPVRVGAVLDYARDLTDRLHQRDRVHTYGSFHLARLSW